MAKECFLHQGRGRAPEYTLLSGENSPPAYTLAGPRMPRTFEQISFPLSWQILLRALWELSRAGSLGPIGQMQTKLEPGNMEEFSLKIRIRKNKGLWESNHSSDLQLVHHHSSTRICSACPSSWCSAFSCGSWSPAQYIAMAIPAMMRIGRLIEAVLFWTDHKCQIQIVVQICSACQIKVNPDACCISTFSFNPH